MALLSDWSFPEHDLIDYFDYRPSLEDLRVWRRRNRGGEKRRGEEEKKAGGRKEHHKRKRPCGLKSLKPTREQKVQKPAVGLVSGS